MKSLALLTILAVAATPPTPGTKAPDFTLSTLTGTPFTLSKDQAPGTTVLVVLRGFPGYQCPLCNRQVQDYLQSAEAFAQAGARILLVYPGPPAELTQRATEFLAGRKLPANFTLLLDPDYRFTNLYGLRWDAPRETAYPSTFLLDATSTVFFAKVAREHGGRTRAADILAEIASHKATR